MKQYNVRSHEKITILCKYDLKVGWEFYRGGP